MVNFAAAKAAASMLTICSIRIAAWVFSRSLSNASARSYKSLSVNCSSFLGYTDVAYFVCSYMRMP